MLISKALVVSNISRDEFVSTDHMLKESNAIKQDIKCFNNIK